LSDSDNFSNNLSNNLYDVIVVGSGPAGVFAARELREKRVLVLDVGYTAKPACLPKENIYSLKKNATESVDDLLLGEQFESLENIKGGTLSPKLKAPLMRFITQRPEAFQKHRGFGFEAVTSFAKGGLANAWGAGVLRFTAADLKGFPIGLQDLRPWYDELSDHIGISGTNPRSN
jgi:choline dehydrogenase-like flavoprotein